MITRWIRLEAGGQVQLVRWSLGGSREVSMVVQSADGDKRTSVLLTASEARELRVALGGCLEELGEPLETPT